MSAETKTQYRRPGFHTALIGGMEVRGLLFVCNINKLYR